jgi:hypothetical protein
LAQLVVPEQITLRELLLADFEIDFPISGGTGNARENPIVVHYRVPNDYVAVEYGVLRCLGVGRGVEWKLLQNSFFELDGRRIEQMRIETKWRTETEVITQIESYYFDLTECFGR